MFDYLMDMFNNSPTNRPSSMRVSLQSEPFPADLFVWFVLCNLPVTDASNMPLSMLPDHIQCAV